MRLSKQSGAPTMVVGVFVDFRSCDSEKVRFAIEVIAVEVVTLSRC